MESKRKLLQSVSAYYSAKLAKYGETASGVDWNGEESQVLRFSVLSRIITKQQGFTINDLGCGYGALFDYLGQHFRDFGYHGVDLSPAMVEAAERRCDSFIRASFAVSSRPLQVADYGIASGIFNVRLEQPEAEWEAHLLETLDVLDETSRLGFAFNCLTSYSDVEKKRDCLYYANPLNLFDYCKNRYSRNVALLHDYELYEFTILVRKRL